jgi:hypothetical protein
MIIIPEQISIQIYSQILTDIITFGLGQQSASRLILLWTKGQHQG